MMIFKRGHDTNCEFKVKGLKYIHRNRAHESQYESC